MKAVEHRYYAASLDTKPNPGDRDALLNKLAADHEIRTPYGVTYKGPALRFSGEMNTSLGNSAVNWLMIHTALIMLDEDPWAFVVEGDDSLIRLHSSNVERFRSIIESFGMRLKLETANRPGDAGFCHQWWTEEHEIVTDVRHRLRQIAYGH